MNDVPVASAPLSPSGWASVLGGGLRTALIYLPIAPTIAAVIEVVRAAAFLIREGQNPLAGEWMLLFMPLATFASALIPAALAGFVTGAGAAWTGPGPRLFLLAAAAGAGAEVLVNGGNADGWSSVAVIAGLGVPPSLAAAWIARRTGAIARHTSGS